MSGINFTQKGLNQRIFSSKAVRATVGAKSGAMKEIMKNSHAAHVLDKAAERRVFYGALKKRGLESKKGITRNVLKKVLGDIEHSGQFSHKEMHELGEVLVGGSASSRIIRDHSAPHEPAVHEQPKRTIRQITDDIFKRDQTQRVGVLELDRARAQRGAQQTRTPQTGAAAYQQKPAADEPKSHLVDAHKETTVKNDSKVVSFGASDSALRRAQQAHVLAGEAHETAQTHAFGHIAEYKKSFNRNADISAVKEMLANIQDEEHDDDQ